MGGGFTMKMLRLAPEPTSEMCLPIAAMARLRKRRPVAECILSSICTARSVSVRRYAHRGAMDVTCPR